MKATNTIFQTGRYRCEWPDQPDSDPPPGRDFAQDLLTRLGAHPGVTLPIDTVEIDSWEHSSWYFFASWRGHDYHITLEPCPETTEPLTWRVDVFRSRQLADFLFGGRNFRFKVEDEFLQIVESSLKELTGCPEITWITESEAITRFWGKPVPPAQP